MGRRLQVDDGVTIQIQTGGSLIFGNNSVLDASGATIQMLSTTGNAVILDGGWSDIRLARLIGPGTGSENGIVFQGAEFSRVDAADIEDFGGAGVLFTGYGASYGTNDNRAFIQHSTLNGYGVLFQGEQQSGDQICEGNYVYGGLFIGNSNAQVQFGDGNHYMGYMPQYNKVYGTAHSQTSLTPVVFNYATSNWFIGSALRDAGTPSISFNNADGNFIIGQPLQQGPPAPGTIKSFIQYQSSGSSGFDSYGFGLSWTSYTAGGGVQFFGGSDAPPSPTVTIYGDLNVTGAITKGSSTFKIDDPNRSGSQVFVSFGCGIT